MKVISVWQPFALLLVKGFKIFETRTWPAPAAVIGQTMGIASTKNVKPEQRAFYEDPDFQKFYEVLGLPSLDELPGGHLLGTVKLDSVELMTPEFLDEVSNEEQAYGHWQEGNYAWRCTQPRELLHPIPIQGKQGIYEWNGELPDAQEDAVQTRQGADQARPADIRSHLRVV